MCLLLYMQYSVTSALFRLLNKFVSCHYLKLTSAALLSSEQYHVDISIEYHVDISIVLSKQKDFSHF